MTGVTRPRVLLADDHAGILGALQRLLRHSCEIVGQVTLGGVVLEAVMTLKPDVVVMDIAMPGLTGLEACRQIKDAMQQVKVIIMTASINEDLKQGAFEAGASAFLSKSLMAENLLDAIHTVLSSREPNAAGR